MAKISITVADITVEKTITDEQATAVLNLYFNATYHYREGDPAQPTARQRLQSCLNSVVGHIVGTARNYRQRELRAANEVAERTEAMGISL